MSDKMPSLPIRRDQDFWLADGSIVLSVEEVLFKVHRTVLAMHSAFFSSMFEGCTAGEDQEGSEARPLAIPDVASKPFANLMRMLYGPVGSTVPQALASNKDDLIALIHLSHRLQFHTVLDVAKDLVRPTLSPMERLGLALTCDIDSWAYDAFSDVVLGFARESLKQQCLVSRETYADVLVARHRVSEARSKFILRKGCNIVGVEQASLLLYSFIIPTTSREQFMAQELAEIDSMPNIMSPLQHLIYFSLTHTKRSEEFQLWTPSTKSEDDIIRAVWHIRHAAPDEDTGID